MTSFSALPRPIKNRSQLHLSRKIYHVSGLAVILFLYYTLSREQALLALTIALVVIVPIDILRIKVSHWSEKLNALFRRVLRNDEMQSLSAMSYLVLGTFVVVAFFPREVGAMALILLGIGDPASSIFGVLYGKDKLVGNKTVQGAFAGFVACTLAAWIYYSTSEIMTERWVLAGLITGIIGAISELVPTGPIDDNFTLPVLGAMLLWLQFYFMGGFV
jgi:diacylglycerol kinase (CTP)